MAAAALVLGLWLVLPNVPRPRSLESWPPPGPGWTPWRPWFQGVEYAQAHRDLPRPMKAHALRVDLAAPGVEVLVNPGRREDGRGITRSQYATTFLRRHRLQVVVSGGAFRPFVRLPGRPVEMVGLAVSNGDPWSPAVPNLDALVISTNGRARCVPAGRTTAGAWQGVGGNLIILRGGTNVAEKLVREPASVAGVSADGRWLYWLVVDGRQPGWSEGVTASEAADLMRELGATDALRMDGGSVVTLAREAWGFGGRVVNRPSHPVWPGVQRPIGSLVGIRARPL